MQRVVMIGNCQIQALCGLYLRFAERVSEQDVTYIRSYENIGNDDRRAIEAAELIVEQVQDFKPTADVAGVSTNAKRILVPVVNAGFLWPFAGQPHPNNPTPPFFEAGPYGAESSDSFLNRMIKKGVEPQSAVQQYVSTDINALINLDRLYEMTIEKQRQRDEATGFQIAEVIIKHFREEAVFRTPYHPNVRVAVSLAAQFFERMDVHKADTDRMMRSIRVTPFPKEELPYHPSVCRHFGLGFVTEQHRYRFMNEGDFTFEEFSYRYMNCIWNEPLEQGLALAKVGKFVEAYERLETGLTLSPNSATGRATLSLVLDGLGDFAKAIAEVRRAIALDPENALYRTQLGVLLLRAADNEAAEHQFRLAAALDPFDPHFPGLLANYLGQRSYSEEAMAVYRLGLASNPRATNLLIGLAGTLSRSGQTEEAERALRDATRWAPKDLAPLVALAKLLSECGRAAEAAILWQQALDGNPDNLDTRVQHVETLLRSGDFVGTECAAQAAIERFPGVGELHHAQSLALKRLGRTNDALKAARTAVNLAIGNVHFHANLADLLIEGQQWDEAELELRSVLASGQQNGHTYFQLGTVLTATKRYFEAVLALREAVRIEPDNPHRLAQLAQMLMRTDNFSDAEDAIRRAIELSPGIAGFHDDLSRILRHLDRRQEAVFSARKALDIEPENVRFRAHLADLTDRGLLGN